MTENGPYGMFVPGSKHPPNLNPGGAVLSQQHVTPRNRRESAWRPVNTGSNPVGATNVVGPRPLRTRRRGRGVVSRVSRARRRLMNAVEWGRPRSPARDDSRGAPRGGAVAAAPGVAGVRVWQITSRGRGPRGGRPLPEGLALAILWPRNDDLSRKRGPWPTLGLWKSFGRLGGRETVLRRQRDANVCMSRIHSLWSQ
jgi:hypothetical protein